MTDDRHDALTRREFLTRSAVAAGAAAGAGAASGLAGLLKPFAVAAAPARVAARPLVYATRTETITLDPAQNDFSYTQRAQRPVYEPLVHYVADGKGGARIEPLLATEWRVSDGGRVYTFRLRSGVRFSDGAPFDADAVKWNFDRVRAVNKGPAARLTVLDRVEVVDRQTVRLVLKAPFAALLPTLTKVPYMISPSAQDRAEAGDFAQRWLNDHATGTGPYLLEQWVRGQQISYSRNPTYWRGWSGQHADRIVLRLVREPATQRLLLETGEADLADGISLVDVDPLKRQPAVVVEEVEAPSLVHIMMRMRGPLADPRFRQAMRAAFGYTSFVAGALLNKGRVPNGPIPKGAWAYDPALPAFRRDLTRARRLLAEVAPSQRTFTLQTISPFFPYYPQLAQIFQQNLAELGLTLSVDDLIDAATFIGNIRTLDRGPDMYGWVVNPAFDDPHEFLFPVYHSSVAGTLQNYTFYKNPRVDALIDQGATIVDQEKRRAIYAEAQRLLREDGPAVFCAQFFLVLGRSRKLQGFQAHPLLVAQPVDYWTLWVEA
ncbi:MAG: ABC transporter substrate-binding protein [Armatimonadota bacterium]|nr:ABC transporter substrate-binding protein [Armatimonadota bacterium]MDR7536073.1 ABC transporter substrate-binding protein [Armatimonadota bacterium]